MMGKPSKIAFYSELWTMGGVLTVTRTLSYFFHSRGIEVYLYGVSVNESAFTDSDREMMKFRMLPSAEMCYDVRDSHSVWSDALREDRIDILISQGFPRIPFGEIRRRTDTRCILCLHGIPFFEEEVRMFNHEQSLRDRSGWLRFRWKYVNRPLITLRKTWRREVGRTWAEAIHGCDRLVCLIPRFAESFRKELSGMGLIDSGEESKFGFIVNPLPPLREPADIDGKEKLVIYSGRLSLYDKRVDRLLEVWALVEPEAPGWRLEIVGDGADRQYLEDMARRLGLRRVSFEGQQTDVVPYYRRASFSCLVSQSEGLGMSLVEGQQCGAIPVCFDMDAIRFVTEGDSGIAVRRYSIKQYAAKILRVTKEGKRRRQMMENALKAAGRYSVEEVGAQWLSLFSEIMKS